ncbi:MAG TPA: hypothetical protein VL309_08755 [Vicinamibacterales bacterium]|nr:hypothetical protein [Vicinamibacterales bacterium]
MFYEDVKVKAGESVSRLAVAYGYLAHDYSRVWNDPKNATLVRSRRVPERLQPGDVIVVPIPWRVTHKTLTVEGSGVGIEVKRSGARGTRLSWVQTVYRHNQPIGPNPAPFCVDACTPDDSLPFYWTNAEIAADPTLRQKFVDHPSRSAPSAAQGTTRWRAIVSIAVMTDKRVTVYDSLVWGFDMTPANAITKVGPRAATAQELAGHLHLLKVGKGTRSASFHALGWTFRVPSAV